jgi:acyltransferase
MNRDAGLDSVRVLGIIAVVAGHVWWDDAVVRQVIYTWHVPVFFFLSGYLWKDRAADGSARTTRSELKSRMKTLAVPYLSWLALISVFYIPWLFVADRATVRYIAGPFIGGAYSAKPYSAFWFLTALFFAALLYRALHRFPGWVPWAISAAGLALAHFAPGLVKAVPLSIGISCGALVFILLGRAARRLETRIRHRLPYAVSLIVVAAAMVFLGSDGLDMKQADFGYPFVGVLVATALSWGLVMFAQVAAKTFTGRASRVISTLAVTGTGVILSHAIVLWATGSPSTGGWQYFVAALLIPWAVMLLVHRTKLSPWLLGTPQARTSPNRPPTSGPAESARSRS